MPFARVNALGWAPLEKLFSAELNQLDIDHSKTLDFVGGDSVATGIMSFTGANKWTHDHPVEVDTNGSITYLGTSKLPQLGTRSHLYMQPLAQIDNLNDRFVWDSIPHGWWIQADVTDAGGLIIPMLHMPAKGTVTEFHLALRGDESGGSAHNAGGIPAQRPNVIFYKKSGLETNWTQVFTQLDTGPSTAAEYDANHTIDVTGLSETYDFGTMFGVHFSGEAGSGSVAGKLALQGIELFVQVTEVGP